VHGVTGIANASMKIYRPTPGCYVRLSSGSWRQDRAWAADPDSSRPRSRVNPNEAEATRSDSARILRIHYICEGHMELYEPPFKSVVVS